MTQTAKSKVSRKNMLYIPKSIAQAVGLKEGMTVRLWVEEGKIVIEPVHDPFELALKGVKFAKTTFKEFEKESEEMQSELLG